VTSTTENPERSGPAPDGVSPNTVVDATVHTQFTWDYQGQRPKLRELYEKGKASQWNASTDIDWSQQITFGTPLPDVAENVDDLLRRQSGSPVPRELHDAFRWEHHAWMTSQFLHGEQGALMATARLVETVPDIDAKLYASSQVVDEARHVEAFARYSDRLGVSYPINPSLQAMLSDIISESRWDIIYLGNQIIVEGIALAAFRLRDATSFDPVIKRITELVAKDEARHVAFGVLSLKGLYTELSSRERAEREEFIKESALLMSDRFRLTEVWERMDLDVAAGTAYTRNDPQMIAFQRMMFAKVVSNLAKLGMLTPGVRAHLDQLALLRPGTSR
jgi:P-aminobenzoate N-oxygenase AurF